MDQPFPKPSGARNDKLTIGPTSNFSNTGFVQNALELTSTLNYVVGRHSLAFGGNYDFTELNILNRANQVAVSVQQYSGLFSWERQPYRHNPIKDGHFFGVLPGLQQSLLPFATDRRLCSRPVEDDAEGGRGMRHRS